MAPMPRIAALAVALLLAGAARAADDTTYLYGAYGYIKTDPGVDKDATDAALQAGGAANLMSTVKQTDSGFKVQFGWMPNKYLAFEVGFAALGTATYDAVFDGGTSKKEF